MVGRPRNQNDLARVVRQRIEELRREGMSQKAIAARCRPPLEEHALSRIATGTIHSPSPERLAALAVGLDMPIRELKAAVLRPVVAAAPAPAPVPPLPRAVAIALQTAPILGPETLARLDTEFARVLREAANGTTDRTR